MDVKKFVGIPYFRGIFQVIRGNNLNTGIFGPDLFDLQIKEYFGLNAHYDSEYGMIVLNECGMLSNPKRELEFIRYSLSRLTIDPVVGYSDSRNLLNAIYGNYLSYGIVSADILDRLVRKFFGPQAAYNREDCVIFLDGWYETPQEDRAYQFVRQVLEALSVEFDPDSCRWLTYIAMD